MTEHSHFVQGVAWDPKLDFIATQSSDRSMIIYQFNALKNTSLKVKARHAKVSNRLFQSADNTDVAIEEKSVRIYHDETLLSFFRRLEFSPDGSLLATPCGIYYEKDELCHCVYLYSRGSLAKYLFTNLSI